MENVKVFYIAIKVYEEWVKNPQAKKAIKMLFKGKRIDGAKNYKGVRLLEVTMPLDDTKEDDIMFYENGGYRVTGRATVKKYDEEKILDFLKEKRG